MSFNQWFRTDAIGDVMLLELRDGISSLADHSVTKELDEIRKLRKRIGFSRMIIDLAQAPFFGSSLLEAIRVLWNDLPTPEGRLVLCNPSPVGREVLEVAKFDHLWPLVETRDLALRMLDVAGRSADWPEEIRNLIEQYESGPNQLREVLSGLSSLNLRTPAPPGQWSALQVVCHIADFELVYADRMKRVVAEEHPKLFGGDPDRFAAKLGYLQRDIGEELDVITAVRLHVARFLKTLTPIEFERAGHHTEAGPLTLKQLLGRIAGHIPHHIKFIEGKRALILNLDEQRVSTP